MADEGTHNEVGTFTVKVRGTGRNRHRTNSEWKLHCDAVALNDDDILLLSIAGPETALRAVTAGLYSSTRDQERIDYSVSVGNTSRALLNKCADGYRVYRTKLDFGLWHVLFLAKTDGFMPVYTEDALWQYLQSDAFTTPLLREWMPWISEALSQFQHGGLIKLNQSGCTAGLACLSDYNLDKVVQIGLQEGHLRIAGQRSRYPIASPASPPAEIKDLDAYMLNYGSILGQRAEQSLDPLHVPGRDPLPELGLDRKPFIAQAHVIEACRKALLRQKSILPVGEMGTGKTLMAMATVHAHAKQKPYRALVFCPGQLINKWEREIKQTIPDAEVIQIQSWKNLLYIDRKSKPAVPMWYVIARDRAKLGAQWQPAYTKRQRDGMFIRCPSCGHCLVTEEREPIAVGTPAKSGRAGTGLWKRRSFCQWVLSPQGTLEPGCKSPLWQMNGEINRYEPALFIKRHLKHFFKYLILDEVHEEKGADTAQGNAAGALAASCSKVIALTGTLIGGYAEHLRSLLFRLAPSSLVNEGLHWSQATAFNERYGRIETRITEKAGRWDAESNRMSRGSKNATKSVKPGIMPALFGRHLIDKAVFLGLSEVADNLPPLAEECISVGLDPEQSRAYHKDVEEPLANAIKEMMVKRDRRLLGAMLQTLLAYPDYPYQWEPVGYWDKGEFVTVCIPPSLSEQTIRPKEQALLDLVRSEKAQNRKVWVYVQYTDKHDVQGRLETLLKREGLRVGLLRASVPLARREEWIAKNAPKLDVIVSHPRLVETGLDLFDKGGKHNFPTLCFYETGYNLFTLRQAARRSWRIGQRENCRIVYFFYERTMQERAMSLMGKKLTAAQALEGTFSTEGLVALAGEDANVELALARSLVERMDEGDVRRMWNKVVSNPVHSCPDVRNENDEDDSPAEEESVHSGPSRQLELFSLTP